MKILLILIIVLFSGCSKTETFSQAAKKCETERFFMTTDGATYCSDELIGGMIWDDEKKLWKEVKTISDIYETKSKTDWIEPPIKKGDIVIEYNCFSTMEGEDIKITCYGEMK